MMTRDLNRFKKNNKGNNKNIIDKIKEGKLEDNDLEKIFPVIHGLNINSKKKYYFYNIIEAREYLNNKEYSKNIIAICKYLLKENKEKIEQSLNSSNMKRLKSSLTLFSYITNNEINSLLVFRNYDKKLIKKVFTESKEYSIFKKLIDKYFDGNLDKKTILLIESEIFEYSNRNIIFSNKDKNSNIFEDLVIKYSEIGSIALSIESKKEQKLKIKEFSQNMTEKEYSYILNLNINQETLKKIKKYKHKLKERLFVLVLVGIIILCGNTITSIEKSLSDNTILVSSVAKQTLIKLEESQPKEIEQESKEESINENVQTETSSVIKELPTNSIKEYSYKTPSGQGNERIVQIALSQVGNKGGEIYWKWYGFNSRVPWCAIFVSWVSNQAGISSNTIPKFSRVTDGVNWFVSNQLFRNKEYIPRSGDLIFFDYDLNGAADHVGIVNRVENGKIFTIEGNSKNDTCLEQSYRIGDKTIYGYGTPNY